MRRMNWNRTFTPFLLLTLAACSPEEADPTVVATGTDDAVVFQGKEDNFISLSAQEYLLTGQVPVTLEAEWAGRSEEEKLAQVQQLIPLRSIQVGWFLNVYLVKKESDAANAGYGGYHALVREGSYKAADVVADPSDPLTYRFKLQFEIGGELSLMNSLPLTRLEDGTHVLRLAMAKVSNSTLTRLEVNEEWYRRYESWKPEGQAADQVEYVDLAIAPEERSRDAYFDYARLLEDGKITASVHFGWDYHSEYHVKHSESLYNWLIQQGYRSPVASYAEYTRTSGPLTRTIQAGDRSIQVEISLYWGKPGTDTDPDTNAGGIQLENDMRDAFAEREIIAYSGHSGPYYGFALANWRKTAEGDLDDSEIAGLELPTDTYQVVLAEGCDTYGIGEAFWHNPAKADRQDLDVITTTAPSNASTPSTVIDFFTALVGTDADGRLVPRKVSELLRDLDGNSSWFHTMYGLHGVDDNPHRHPFAVADQLCETGCGNQADCGGTGNRCVALLTGAPKACTFECTSDDGCPEGYACERIASQGAAQASFVCAPRSRSCGTAPSEIHGTLEQSGTIAKNAEQRFQLELPVGIERLQVILRGTGDADLYVRRGEPPTTSTYDCRPYTSGSDEECTFDGPAAGPWHLMVRGYAASSSFELKALW